MRLKDDDIERCSEAAIKASMRSVNVPDDLVDAPDFIHLYCEAVTFVLGLHPEGRFANFEDLIVSSTESGLKIFNGPYIAHNQMEWEMEPSDETKRSNLEFNAKLAADVKPSYFIEMFVTSNLYGEGTPAYISNHIG